jgi:hypothetical protein
MSMFSQYLPIFWATLRNTNRYQFFVGQPEVHQMEHQAAHFNLLWPNEIHIIGVMEEFETGATFTLGPAHQVPWMEKTS